MRRERYLYPLICAMAAAIGAIGGNLLGATGGVLGAMVGAVLGCSCTYADAVLKQLGIRIGRTRFGRSWTVNRYPALSLTVQLIYESS